MCIWLCVYIHIYVYIWLYVYNIYDYMYIIYMIICIWLYVRYCYRWDAHSYKQPATNIATKRVHDPWPNLWINKNQILTRHNLDDHDQHMFSNSILGPFFGSEHASWRYFFYLAKVPLPPLQFTRSDCRFQVWGVWNSQENADHAVFLFKLGINHPNKQIKSLALRRKTISWPSSRHAYTAPAHQGPF